MSNRKALSLRFTNEELSLIIGVVEKVAGPVKTETDLKRMVKSIVMNVTRKAAAEIIEEQKKQAKELASESESRESTESTEAVQLSENSNTDALADTQNNLADT